MFDIERFSLADMTDCGRQVRALGVNAASLEEVSERLVQFFYREFCEPDSLEPCFPLVRVFRTKAFHELDPELRRFASSMLGNEPWLPTTKCLSLLATAGRRAEWNDVQRSINHRVIPLASPSAVQNLPMIAQLVYQLGLEVSQLLDPRPEMLPELSRRSFGVFFEPDALNSSAITAKDDFVVPEGIRSCLGFGGVFPSGDLFAVILFSKLAISREVAGMFGTLALSARLCLLPFAFDEASQRSRRARVNWDLADVRQSTYDQLLQAQESSIRIQAERIERESQELYRTVFDSGNDGIIISDPLRDRILDANSRAQEMLLYTHEEIVNIPLSAIHPYDLDAFRAFGTSVLREGRGWTDELRCVTKQGDGIPVELSASAVEISGQKCIIAIIRDISERLRAEATSRELMLVEERHRLARELHDSVTQLLYSSTLFSQAGLREAERRRLPELIEIMREVQSTSTQALKEMRLMLYQLGPDDLKDSGFEVAVNARLESVERRSGVQAELYVEPGISLQSVAQEALYRISQEALNNSLNHANASRVLVSMERSGPQFLVLSIKDDGSGFDTTRGDHGGMGLKNIESRAKELSGRLRIQSSRGFGTTVEVTIPAEKAIAANE